MKESAKGIPFFAPLILAIACLLGMCVALPQHAWAADGNVAKVGNDEYLTLQEAIDAAGDGSEIELLADVNENLSFTKGGTFVLNLAGHIVSAPGGYDDDIVSISVPNLTLTVKDGTMLGKGYGFYSYAGANNLNLVLDGVALTSVTQPIGVQGNNENQNVTIVNSTVTSSDVVVYFPPKSGLLSIQNSILSGVTNGIVVKGGAVEITGDNTVISATGPHVPQDNPYGGAIGGANFPETGDAIYVEGGYYDRPIEVSISGGTFESTNAEAVNMQFAGDSQNTSVSGGAFSSLPVEYMVEDSVALAENGQYSVMSADAALSAGPVAKVVVDGKDVYFLSASEAEEFADSVTTPGGDNLTVIPLAFTVTFDDGSAKTTQQVTSGGTVAKPADPVKDGFVFKGWFADEALTQPYNFETPVTADITIYAKWEKAQQQGGSDVSGGNTSGTDKPSGDKPANGKTASGATFAKTGDTLNVAPILALCGCAALVALSAFALRIRDNR